MASLSDPYYALLSSSIANNYKTRAASNPWSVGGNSIASAALPYRPGDTNPWGYLAASIAKGLLGGAMSGYGEASADQYRAAQQSALAEALTSEAPAEAFQSNEYLKPLAGDFALAEAAREQAVKQEQLKQAMAIQKSMATKGMMPDGQGGWALDPSFAKAQTSLAAMKSGAQANARLGAELGYTPKIEAAKIEAQTKALVGDSAPQDEPAIKELVVKVPPKQLPKALAEIGIVKEQQQAKEKIAEAYDVIANSNALRAQIPYTKENAKVEAAKGAIMSNVVKLWTGPMSDSDMKRIEGLLGKAIDPKENTEVRKKQMLEVLDANSKATPTLDAFGVNKQSVMGQTKSTTSAPGRMPGESPSAYLQRIQGGM